MIMKDKLILIEKIFIIFIFCIFICGCGTAKNILKMEPNQGIFNITTVPEGANAKIISHDGKKFVKEETTPVKIELLPGKYTVILSKGDMYESTSTDFSIEPGKTTELKDIKLSPKFGMLRISTEPEGAKIFLDGKLLEGKTPMDLSEVKIGELRIRVEYLPNYMSKEETVNVVSDKYNSILIKLEVNYGTISITTIPEGANTKIILFDGKRFITEEITPVRIELMPGKYIVVISKGDMYESKSTFINIETGKTTELKDIKLSPKFGMLRISTEPEEATVFLDDKLIEGKTPMDLSEVKIGEHRIRVEYPPDYMSKEETVNVVSGKLYSISIKLEANHGILSITTIPEGANAKIILFNGKRFVREETTPVKIELLPGKYTVILSKGDMYESTSTDFSIEPGKTTELKDIKLSPKFGMLRISTEPEGATVFLDDKLIEGKTPMDLSEVKIGEHRIRVEYLPIYVPKEKTINIVGDEIIEIKIELIPIPFLRESFVRIPEGWFKMGDDRGNKDEKPVTKIYLSEYWIGEHEIAVEEYAKYINATKYKNPIGNCDCNWEKSDYKNHPINCISWNDAQMYVKWLSENNKYGLEFRLPTEAEWEKAARGPNGWIFPWGNEWDGKRVNFSDKNSKEFLKDKSIDDGYANTSPIGSYENGRSYYGVYDMAGNVREWTNSLYRPYPYDSADGREDINSLGERVVRGGSWKCVPEFQQLFYRTKYPSSAQFDDVGFRVVISGKNNVGKRY